MPDKTYRYQLPLIVVIAIGLRAYVGLDTVAGEDVRLFPDDPPYHLLRVQTLLQEGWPKFEPDPLVAHPYGSVPVWPWGFDYLCAAVAWMAPGREALLCAWLIPVLGGLLVPLAFVLARPALGTRRAMAVAMLTALLPAHVAASMLGRVDHHVLEPVLFSLAALGPITAIRASSRGAWTCILSGLAMGLLFACCPVAMPLAALVLIVTGPFLAAADRKASMAFAFSSMAFTYFSLLISPRGFSWTFHTLSLLHASLLTAICLGIAVAAIVRAFGFLSLAIVVGVAIALLCGLAIAVDDFVPEVLYGLAYLRGSGILRLSLEAQPLWSDPGRVASLLSPLCFFSPLGAMRLVVRPGAHGRTADVALGLLALGAMAMATLQRRFLVAATPFMTLAMVEGVALTGKVIGNLGERLRLRPKVAKFAASLAILAAFAPALTYLAEMQPLTPRDKAMYAAAAVVRVPSGQGALVPWDAGHVFQLAGVPVVCDNFIGEPAGDAALMRCLGMLYEEDKGIIEQKLEELRIHAVVLVPPHPKQVRLETALLKRDPNRYVSEQGVFKQAFADTMWGQLGLFGHTARPGEEGPFGLRLVARLVVRDTEGQVASEVLVFERTRNGSATLAPR